MVDMRVGDIVTIRPSTYDRAGRSPYQDRVSIRDGHPQLRITRVFFDRIIVRGSIWQGEEASIYVWKNAVLTVNGVDSETGLIPRVLGTKPEDTEEMTYIGLDHPGIQWAWADFAEYANGKDWCELYDELARRIGIPGRPEEFEVEVEIEGGIILTAEIEAQTEAEAQAEFERRLAAYTG